MATGSGYYDDLGIYHFGEDDVDALASDMLNRLSGSVHAALSQLSVRQTRSETPGSVPANNTAVIDVTFDHPFVSAPEMGAPSFAAATNSLIPFYAAVTPTGFKLIVRNVSGSAVTSPAVRWVARGVLA